MRHESTAENGKDGDDAGGKGEADAEDEEVEAEDEEEENVSNDDEEDDDGKEEAEVNWVTEVVGSLECRRGPHYKVLLDKADTRVPLPLHTPPTQHILVTAG